MLTADSIVVCEHQSKQDLEKYDINIEEKSILYAHILYRKDGIQK